MFHLAIIIFELSWSATRVASNSTSPTPCRRNRSVSAPSVTTPRIVHSREGARPAQVTTPTRVIYVLKKITEAGNELFLCLSALVLNI